MKTVKRIFAVAVAVLLIAMMIPAVSAASHDVNWTCSKPGYTYEVYKVASYSSTTGAFTATDPALADLVNASDESTAALAAACKDATGMTNTGISFTTDAGSGKVTLPADGMYYFKLSKKSPKFKATTGDVLVVFPNKNKTTSETIDFGAKINEGEPTVDKSFLIDGAETKTEQSFGTGDVITYVLTADIAGSVNSKLTSYVITDKMGNGLNKGKHDVKSVVLKNGSTETALAYTVTEDSAVINRAKDDTLDKNTETLGNTFGVVIDAGELAKDGFYKEGNKVVVTYETELAADAALATQIPNTDDLIYGNDSGYYVVPGKTVICKTYAIKAYKVDATTGEKLAGAEFTLYDVDHNVLATATSAARTGEADFGLLLAEGTYYVKETKQPNGYNLNSKEETIALGPNTPDGLATVTIKDTKAKLPETGGAGTLVFTIVGGSLVLLAAALFIVVMKKRSSAK